MLWLLVLGSCVAATLAVLPRIEKHFLDDEVNTDGGPGGFA